MTITVAAIATGSVAFLLYYIYWSLFSSPLARIPGPKSFALTKWRLAYEDYKGSRTRKIHALHERYGPVVRIGPNEVAFNSLSALRAIYGAGSCFERTNFYHMFAIYGRKNMFSFNTVKQHGERKKLFAHAYAKSAMLKGRNAHMIETKVRKYMELLEREGRSHNIFTTLHYFSLDNITEFLYGDFGKTACLDGTKEDRALLHDILATGSRTLSWFTVHHPKLTAWLYSQTGIIGCVARQFYPMQKPTPYTSIKLHATNAFQRFADASLAEKAEQSSLISKLWKHHHTMKDGGLDDLDIASECADQLDGGIDTTSDTLMFTIWSLSRPEHKKFQQKLIDEARSLSQKDLNADGIPGVEAADKLPYAEAVIKETLRLFAPLPASEPRSSPEAITIDGYLIPARTVVSISPYTLHRNADVFIDPLKFNPDRWLDPSQDLTQMNRFFWAFSSGGRMCIGMHLAMAEMTTFVAALYRKYTTETRAEFDKISPGITSRFEVFYDEGCSGVREHECQIEFRPQ
ncbi:benzoate 4-monooxygenase cytochrome P450 [Aspergillus nomiae NRRL 13137]|uniref:Benzoate 4-monooxygenase cytochrome P450 n=1 Tax=Aspergillus nomiae NRRL (strain ATCC 15546 / NRRL 13137 / CBS 260.88 / M93) TaxID=1509407 RepID=A0A0L1J600_ASPN3|nr:benzoate 4-monooxygenase cytochrome P450 [Aspergillus nomiae NRRL 13137]KNG87164.1 benzoate 4-monooxygenase cytochrome P450 [Aspergillus nomiae NRRL 13137]